MEDLTNHLELLLPFISRQNKGKHKESHAKIVAQL
jgi:hypothetical protein